MRRVRPGFKGEAAKLRYSDPTVAVTPDGLYRDIWGAGYQANPAPVGFYMDLADSPLKNASSLADLEGHAWPKVEDWIVDTVPAQVKAAKECWVWFNTRGVFEVSWFMRGFENFMMDLAGEPDMACYLMDRVLAHQIARARRILDAAKGRIDMVEYNDDMGTQTNLFMSPDMWRQYIKPRMAEFIRVCKKEYNVAIRYHSCGAIRPIINDLIDIGVDMLNPVQVLATGMEPEGLARDFGGRITFNGGIDTQELLPRATPQQVADETRRIIGILGKGNGLVLAPSHRFQADVPVENILALYETATGWIHG